MRSLPQAMKVAAALSAFLCAVGIASAATDEQSASSSGATHTAHVAPSKVVVRQTFAIGRQATRIQGVKVASNGSVPGSVRKVKARLGSPWSCSDGINRWRGGRVVIRVDSLFEPSCDPANQYPVSVSVDAPGARLNTDRGNLRIGQNWSKVPSRFKRMVMYTNATRTGVWRYAIGARRQDHCNPKRPKGAVQEFGRIWANNRGKITSFDLDMEIVDTSHCPR